MRRLPAVGLLAVAGLGCSTPSMPSNSSQIILHAEVVDAAGDATSDPRLPVAPDLLRATADVANGNLTIVVTLAPSTFDPTSMGVDIYLDTDRNPATGAPAADGIASGADYLIVLDSRFGPVSVFQYDPLHCPLRCFIATKDTFVVAADASSTRATVPLSALGNTDGRMTFQTRSWAVTPLFTFNPDYMPDVGLPPVRIQ